MHSGFILALLQMNYLNKFIRKFFLTREIVSREGKVHFRRYRLLETPWFSVYIHNICESDLDLHMHDHPWDFTTILIKGGYKEYTKDHPVGWYYLPIGRRTYDTPGMYMIHHRAEDMHKIQLLDNKPAWSLFLCGPRRREFGYDVDGKWVHNKTYRELKDKNLL
jgi:hypothetical protein